MTERYIVKIEARFEAAHNLRSYRGVEEPLHGHSYRVEAFIRSLSESLDEDDIAVDFISSRSKLELLAKKLDYNYINRVPPFTEINPTAENVAAWFHRELSSSLRSDGAVVDSITLWEGPVNSVSYRPGS